MTKKLIINEKQLKALNEITIGVNANGQSSSEYTKAATSPTTQGDIQKARGYAQDVDAVVSGPKSNDDSVVVDVDVPAGTTLQNVMNQNQENQAAINAGAKAKIHGDGFVTEQVFSKKQIEEARIANMKENGIHYTKKQLKESFKNGRKA